MRARRRLSRLEGGGGLRTSNNICDATACVTQCTFDCTTLNARRFVAGTNDFETCKEVQPGCLEWQATTSCGSSKVCAGAGVCVCNDQCTTVGQITCTGSSSYVNCVRGSDQCLTTTSGSCKTSTVCFASPSLCANSN